MKSNWKTYFGVGKQIKVTKDLLVGAEGEIVRGSQRTQARIVKLTKDFSRGYPVGTEVELMPFEYEVQS